MARRKETLEEFVLRILDDHECMRTHEARRVWSEQIVKQVREEVLEAAAERVERKRFVDPVNLHERTYNTTIDAAVAAIRGDGAE